MSGASHPANHKNGRHKKIIVAGPTDEKLAHFHPLYLIAQTLAKRGRKHSRVARVSIRATEDQEEPQTYTRQYAKALTN